MTEHSGLTAVLAAHNASMSGMRRRCDVATVAVTVILWALFGSIIAFAGYVLFGSAISIRG